MTTRMTPMNAVVRGLVNHVTHWAFGVLNGAAYGLVAGSIPTSRVSYGSPFVRTLGDDLSAHLVYGLATAATWRVV
jgi:hypothetical protein